ncbi:MAG: glutamine-hydrolyzing GMP synthase [Deltaproteobacteria bacterium]|nr:glutamine-hydrolyzing GMP synthase [Deltaproteobacteria bacterium]
MTLSGRDYIAVVDFGGQYAHLIAKRIRHHGVYTRVVSPVISEQEIADARGIILSGGPASVFGEAAVPFNKAIAELNVPLLGLCYGHQLLALLNGGRVRSFDHGEYGKTGLELLQTEHPLMRGVSPVSEVWMSHGDTVESPPPGFGVLGRTALCPVAAMAHESRPVYGLQFHPEVSDSRQGDLMLGNFVEITGAARGWNMQSYLEEVMDECRTQVDSRNVLMFLSGGVDSTVAFALLTRALGAERVKGLLIDNGFMRKDEVRQILERYARLGLGEVDCLEASEEFLQAVAGLSDPQEKRKAVGETFLRVRETYLASLSLDPQQWLLGQGTLYPDIIESGGSDHAAVIKFHHNRVERIEEMIAAGHVVEPLKELYKDEVRALGEALELPEELVWRHPFPGPGLSINVLCAGGDEHFPELEPAGAALHGLLEDSPYEGAVLQVRSVGVQGDSRTYTPPAVVYGPRDWDLLEELSIRITNNLRAVNRVVTLLAPETLPELRLRRAFCTRDRLDLLREADHLATRALEEGGLMRVVFQLLVILLPLSADGRGDSLVLRPVISEDVMTARFAPLPWEVVNPLAEKLLALSGVDAVFFDVTHKPPATFGWE